MNVMLHPDLGNPITDPDYFGKLDKYFESLFDLSEEIDDQVALHMPGRHSQQSHGHGGVVRPVRRSDEPLVIRIGDSAPRQTAARPRGGNAERRAQAIASAESEIRHSKRETGVVIDDDGNVVFRKEGSVERIEFTPEEAMRMKDHTFTHNHPDGTTAASTFSGADLDLAERANVRELRAVTTKATYSMERPDSGWPSGLAFDHMGIEQQTREELFGKILSKEITQRKAESMFWDMTMERTAAKHGIKYTKTAYNG